MEEDIIYLKHGDRTAFRVQSIECIDIDNLAPSVISIQNSVSPSHIKKANENERA